MNTTAWNHQRVEITCAHCGKKFMAQRKSALYCSEECRETARNMRRRARHGTTNLLYIRGKTGGCRGCVDWENNACEYLRNNGHCRPCQIHKDGGCDLYSPIERPRATEGERRGWSTAKAEKLLKSGLTAAEVADKLGCAPNSVKAWINHKEVQTR